MDNDDEEDRGEKTMLEIMEFVMMIIVMDGKGDWWYCFDHE